MGRNMLLPQFNPDKREKSCAERAFPYTMLVLGIPVHMGQLYPGARHLGRNHTTLTVYHTVLLN